MKVFLGLGSNLGDRRKLLRQALGQLGERGVAVERVSPAVESPAMLPAAAPDDWNRPFLNLVAACDTTLPPDSLLVALQEIEVGLGRSDSRTWSPRPIDIDILLYDDLELATDTLTVPHAGLTGRNFFLTPLCALRPDLIVPGTGVTALALSRTLGRSIPLWMGIVNLTPDSFSDGGDNATWTAVESTVDAMIASGVHILDLGAESTRPGAAPLTAEQEWSRLEPILGRIVDKLAGDPLAPRISVDTYHASVAARSLALGADIINDVGGLTEDAMIELAASSPAEFIAMHHLGLPADPSVTLSTDTSATSQIERWLDEQRDLWQARGIATARIVFDPGIGFGKTRLQSLDILRNIDRFVGQELRLLVGHSRKSFMQDFAARDRYERDLVSIGASLELCSQGVDIIRVHNVKDHVFAYRGWSHVTARA